MSSRLIAAALALTAVAASVQEVPRPFTGTFRVEADEWSSTGDNPWFPLQPGRFVVLAGEEDGRPVELTITVLDETRRTDGVETRVVEERETAGGELVEVSRNYFAASKRTSAVYYFGEDVEVWRDGKVVGTDGSWHAGEDGARFGLMMPGTPLLGARYWQEQAPDVAMDRAEIVGVGEEFAVAGRTLADCVRTEESSALEAGRETKRYAPGIGQVSDGSLKFVRQGQAGSR